MTCATSRSVPRLRTWLPTCDKIFMPHYRNARMAQEGDPVVYERQYDKRIIAGALVAIMQSASCNGVVCYPIVGGIAADCVTLSEVLHAADALTAFGMLQFRPPPVDNEHVAPGCEKFTEPTVKSPHESSH